MFPLARSTRFVKGAAMKSRFCSKSDAKRPRHGDYRRRLLCEPLESRRLLSAAASQQTMQLFDASPALFAANQGQWADPSVRYVFQGDGANIAMTDAGPVFQVFQQPPATATQAASQDSLASPIGKSRG